MDARRALALVTMLTAVVTSACSAAVESNDAHPVETSASTGQPTDVTTSTTTASTTPNSSPTTSTTNTTSTTSTTSTTTTSTTSTTSTTLPPLDVYDPTCVVQVRPNQGLADIADRFDDDTVDPETIMAENGLDSPDLEVDQLLDVCVDNGLNDIDGSERTGRNEVVARREVEAQQSKLNELFAGYGIDELLVDGISGPVTRQQLCAFRLAAGLPVSLTDMEAGSHEEAVLMATETLPTPFTSAILSERWVLIDRTCQVMFVGTGTQRLDFVFPTSTGGPGHRTRDQDRTPVFKYNPAAHNGGWHNSLTYPAAEDNPLNGNMYKPLYFDNGLAIHGSNNVPRYPASKGCTRLRVAHHDMLIEWLGLADQTEVTYRTSQINLTVNVQGRYDW